MRIIAGTFGGRRLEAPRDRSVRPTTDRVKQSVFDILTTRIDFEGVHVLDLFSGSGSLGLEALSRGAASVTFVDTSRTSLALLEKNVRLLGCSDQATVQQADVFWFLKNSHRRYELVFVDPPFALDRIGELPSVLDQSGVLNVGTYVVMEHGKNSEVMIPEQSFEVVQKQFGQTMVLILKSLRESSENGLKRSAQ